ncbi:hypothetical protein DL96DRAFT_805049 [Flagelloscypha sp. PMI_526]|nr:hypothetical protein DL96DRAFT_805049 [Flagelloscypha sp. PMI_526]
MRHAKSHWKKHKEFCKASRTAGNPLDINQGSPSTDWDELNRLVDLKTIFELNSFNEALGRELVISEAFLLFFQPRCLACARTDAEIHHTTSLVDSHVLHPLKPCPDCKMVFYCSSSHWDIIRKLHSEDSCPERFGGHNGLTHCAILSHHQKDQEALLKYTHRLGKWIPDRRFSSWSSFQGSSWIKELEGKFDEPDDEIKLRKIRCVSNPLSLPMTILYGLDVLNGEDRSWTKKKSLLIHAPGADVDVVDQPNVYEEILHRLPDVFTVTLVLIDSNFRFPLTDLRRKTETLSLCQACQSSGRSLKFDFVSSPYRTYAQSTDAGFDKPDFAVGFYTRLAREPSVWLPTIQLLKQRGVPSIFTSEGPLSEAQSDAMVLKAAGVKCHPMLQAVRNPWGSNVGWSYGEVCYWI